MTFGCRHDIKLTHCNVNTSIGTYFNLYRDIHERLAATSQLVIPVITFLTPLA
jgi:hypothetical protein